MREIAVKSRESGVSSITRVSFLCSYRTKVGVAEAQSMVPAIAPSAADFRVLGLDLGSRQMTFRTKRPGQPSFVVRLPNFRCK